MKRLVSLTMVLAFFVVVPQCFGQSQAAEKDASQLLTEQQLVQMFHLLMVQRPETTIKVCHITPGPMQAEGEGFTLRIPEESPSLAGHCAHGDCTMYSVVGPGNRCVCDGGDDGLEVELCV